MSEDLSFLEDTQEQVSSNLMQSIQQNVAELRRLGYEMMEAEEVFNKAKRAYEDYSRKVLPDIFRLNGLNSLVLDDGNIVSVVTKTAASVVKKDKPEVCKWLRQHNGDHLIKESLEVPVSCKDALAAAGIDFSVNEDVNTNALKAFLLSELGQKESPATITVDDLPKGISWYQWDEMEVTHK